MEPVAAELRDIPGFEGLYAITRDGQIWSYPKGRKNHGHWMSPSPRKDDYLMVCLRKDGKAYTPTVHLLVYRTWIGEIPAGMEVDHKDDDQLNNRDTNFQLLTRSENAKKMWRGKNRPCHKGSSNSRAILTEAQVLRIREAAAKGISSKDIKHEFGISRYVYHDVINRRRWTHI